MEDTTTVGVELASAIAKVVPIPNPVIKSAVVNVAPFVGAMAGKIVSNEIIKKKEQACAQAKDAQNDGPKMLPISSTLPVGINTAVNTIGLDTNSNYSTAMRRVDSIVSQMIKSPEASIPAQSNKSTLPQPPRPAPPKPLIISTKPTIVSKPPVIPPKPGKPTAAPPPTRTPVHYSSRINHTPSAGFRVRVRLF